MDAVRQGSQILHNPTGIRKGVSVRTPFSRLASDALPNADKVAAPSRARDRKPRVTQKVPDYRSCQPRCTFAGAPLNLDVVPPDSSTRVRIEQR